jgi:CRISPR-associated protein Cmr3
MQGVIRSARLAQSGASFTNQSKWPSDVGGPNDSGKLRLRGPILAKRVGANCERLFPLPLDVTKLKSGWHVLSPSEQKLQANWPSSGLRPLLPPPDSEPEKFEPGWLCEEAFLAYLRRRDCRWEPFAQKDLFESEPRFGVEIDSGPKQQVEGRFYQIGFVRPAKDVGLLVEVDGIEFPKADLPSGLLQLGGEARAGYYATVDKGMGFPPEGRLTPGHPPLRFKLYLATPAIFNNGWLPGWINRQSMRGTRDGVALELVAAAVGKPQPIGGRDLTRSDQQRPIHRAVPAGSVYFFTTEAKREEVFKTFDGRCVSDRDTEIGFGLCYVGGW